VNTVSASADQAISIRLSSLRFRRVRSGVTSVDYTRRSRPSAAAALHDETLDALMAPIEAREM
jgi:hypothetical protein